MSKLLSVNVGLPQDIRWRDKTVHTAVWKHSVAGKCRVRHLNIDGDKQGDLVGHGGEQRAVLVYQIESYHHWEHEFGRHDFVFGQFGENLTVSGLPDDEVCIGDRFQIGSAVFEVSQPRVTCYRVGIRMGEPRMAALLVAHHRPGFYMRVITEGEVEAGDAIVKVADGPEQLTVAAADALLYLPGRDLAQVERALRIDAFSPGWTIAFRDMERDMRGAGSTENKGLILNSGSPAAWSGFRPLRVARIHAESLSVFSLELVLNAGARFAPAAPGQFITLRLPIENGKAPLLRSYSLTATSDPTHYSIAVKEEPHGAASHYLREHVHVGDTLDTAAPRGGFVLRQDPRPVVLLSAGIGVTPVLAMLRALAESASPRTLWWCHGARNGAEHPFAREAETLLRALPNSHRVIAYSRPLPADRLGIDFDIEGRLDVGALRRLGVPGDADFYLCGPDSFMHDLGDGLLAVWGIPPARVLRERFGPGQPFMPGIVEQTVGPVHAPPGAAGTGPLVSFARSGLTVNWDDRFASLIELAEACNVKTRFACRTGVCHTCISRLMAGTVAYRPEPLERPSKDNVLICCSQPTADVVIDI
ncbi:MAG: MOSC domain-containing protein [Rhodanobacteraceae bacterium]|nr:MAG: MOSC domain-containing protein [Rhodanobacteraceae bacterium]